MSYIAFPTITVCDFMIIMKIESNYSDYNVFQALLGKAEIEHNYLCNIFLVRSGVDKLFSVKDN